MIPEKKTPTELYAIHVMTPEDTGFVKQCGNDEEQGLSKISQFCEFFGNKDSAQKFADDYVKHAFPNALQIKVVNVLHFLFWCEV